MKMRTFVVIGAVTLLGCFTVSAAQAACTGSNGRGWASGNGAGKFEMVAADKSCQIGLTNVIDDRTNAKIPATNVVVTQPPKSGTVNVTSTGLIYKPKKGFMGSDTFCTKNTTPKVPGVTLSGCITVSVK